jgi:CheY-like chemotaxis protein
MNSGRIVVVDDTAINRMLLTGILGDAGFEVRAASNGTEAVAMISADPPEMILLDVQMPDMSGYDVCRLLKQNSKLRPIPVVFISALDDVAEKVKGFEAGGVDYVTKPFEPAEVLARVGSQVHLYRLQSELKERNYELQRRNEQLVLAQQRTERVFLALSEALPGTVLDDTYRLDAKIGEGGFGAVFRGTHLRLQRPVAIKVLRPGGSSADDLARFRLEGIAACRFNHPNAVDVIDFGVSSNGIAYLVMELLHGRTLSEMLHEEHVLPVGRCAEIIGPVCDALAAAHAAGIVHRDIKPQNIYLHRAAGQEVVKVVDFGIAKLVDVEEPERAPGLTQTGTLIGTPEYMAPERLLCRPYDDRSDIYSVGVMLYLMLSGEMPFRPETPPTMIDMIQLHMNGKPRHLRDIARPNVPAETIELVMATLDSDPAARPALPAIASGLRSMSAATAPA